MPFPEVGASASCAGPEFTKDRIVLNDTGEQSVSAKWLRDGCNDGGTCSVGCSGSCETEDDERPTKDVELRISQMGRSWSLGTVDADEDYNAAWTFELPGQVHAGKARLLATGIRPMEITIR